MSQQANEADKAEKAAQPHTVNHYINVAPPSVTIQPPAVHVDAPTVKVDAPIVNVAPPEVLVDIGATTINATFEPPAKAAKVTKTITATRGADGQIIGKVIEE